MSVPLALVITELEPGGAERCLVELATRIERTRFSPVVYSLAPRPAPGRDQLAQRLESAGVPTHYLNVNRAREYFAAVRRLSGHLREQRPAVVQSFLVHANIVAVRAARQAGVPVIVTGIRVADPRWWLTAAERLATAHACRHVCVSQNVAEFSRGRGLAAEKLVVIPNGIEVCRWRNARPAELASFGIPAGRRVLLFVGRLDRQKGLDRLLEDLPAVFAAQPDHDLLVVGEGPERKTLERQAQRRRIGDRVHFAGWQTEIPGIMAAATALVVPSRWEGMPNVVLEAMAAGKPVIATQAEGTVELLGLGALDQTSPLGDRPGFRRKLLDILRNPQLTQQLGHRNQERAEQFSLVSVVERYQRLYGSLLST